MKKNLSIIFFVVILILAGYFLFWIRDKGGLPPEGLMPQTGQWFVTVSFEFDPDNISSFNYEGEGSKSLFNITQSIVSENKWGLDFEDYGDMGWLVTQIGTQANGDDNKYWQYFVNDKQPMISVEKFYPEHGDKIEWKFIESEF